MDTKNLEALNQEVETLRNIYATRHGRNYLADWLLALLSLLITASISILGVWGGADAAKTMAVMSIINAAVIGGHRLGAFRELAEFQRLVSTEAANLLTELQLAVQTDEQFLTVVKRLQTLREHSARNLPRGEGVQAAVNLREELKAQV